jgi:hypothetical protein
MGALIPLAISLAPEIANWLFGAQAEKTVAAVSDAVRTATGASDLAAQQAVIERDPQVASTLRVQLAQIAATASAAARQSDLDTLRANLADVASARAQTVALAQAKSPVAYSASIVSVVVLATFGGVMGLAITRSMPPGSEPTLNLLLGSLAAMASAVVSYWVGSSAGSARKEAHLATIATKVGAATKPQA